MPLVLPKAKRRAHPDGKFLSQVLAIARRSEFGQSNSKHNALFDLTTRLEPKQFVETLTMSRLRFEADNNDPASTTSNSEQSNYVNSKNWIEMLNQHHVHLFETKIETQPPFLFIGLKKPAQKFHHNLIFDKNVIRTNYARELTCLTILFCTSNLEQYHVVLDKNLFFDVFIEYLKTNNNILYLRFLKLARNILITTSI